MCHYQLVYPMNAMHEWNNIRKSINVIQYFKRLKSEQLCDYHSRGLIKVNIQAWEKTPHCNKK